MKQFRLFVFSIAIDSLEHGKRVSIRPGICPGVDKREKGKTHCIGPLLSHIYYRGLFSHHEHHRNIPRPFLSPLHDPWRRSSAKYYSIPGILYAYFEV